MPNEIRITRNKYNKYDVVVVMDNGAKATESVNYHEITQKVDELVRILEKTIDKN